MERTDQRQDESLTIDLGAVTAETKGGGTKRLDVLGEEDILGGLSDD